MKRKPYKYMHTIDGQPGHYDRGEQICFASINRPIPLCDTLEQIRKEQRDSTKWRIAQGFTINSKYNYVKVKV